ncbi:MAG: DinB family protein [Gemmatimonadota bacterium]
MSDRALLDDLRVIIGRDLDGLQRELELYPDDASVWVLPEGVPNSAGTLALHLVGNLRHFIGALLGGSGYVRDREAEFGDRDLPRSELITRIDAARTEVLGALDRMSPDVLDDPFAMPNGASAPFGRFLVHLAVHLGYHLGQVDYHRRMVTGEGASAQMLGLKALA